MLQNRVSNLLLSIICLILCSFIFYSFYNDKDILQDPQKESKLTTQVVRSLDLPTNLDFAGERIPLEQFDVRDRFNRELLVNVYWHSNTILNIQKASRYFPLIESILAETGVPQDFKYLAVAESSLRNATSPASAKGFWQIMKATGKAYGLEINKAVDERYHIEKSTRAACKYLNHLKKKFGSWTIAAAAYNRGETGIRKNMTKQKASNYFDLNLNEETARYVFRIAAIKEVMSNPEKYGFYVAPEHKYRQLNDYVVFQNNQTITSLADFAAQKGISYRMLKIYNPWMVSTSLPNTSKKVYKIKIPKNSHH